jgi:cellulose biosynthesis protein BcsQ
LPKSIAFHSYKGGTGKTTLAVNLAALLAKRGSRVFILDLDVYAPSLQSYFGEGAHKQIGKYFNDYVGGGCEVDDLILDITPTIKSYSKDAPISGNLFACFSSPKREDILKIEGVREDKNKLNMLKRFIVMKEKLFTEHDADYIILDSSPGIRFWAINALAVADNVLLTLKMGDLDVQGTKMIAKEILEAFQEHGTKPYLLLNRISGYCMAPVGKLTDSELITPNSVAGNGHERRPSQVAADDVINMLTRETNLSVITAIPCYCDIQFSQREFLTALEYPEHPFSSQINGLIEKIDKEG